MKLRWLGRPNVGLAAILVGAYATLRQGMCRIGRGVVNGITTVLLFACVPQAAHPLGNKIGATWEGFTDAAPKRLGY